MVERLFVSFVNFDVIGGLKLSVNSMINWREKEQSRNHSHICERKKKITECVELCKLRDQGRTLKNVCFQGLERFSERLLDSVSMSEHYCGYMSNSL